MGPNGLGSSGGVGTASAKKNRWASAKHSSIQIYASSCYLFEATLSNQFGK